MAQGGEESRRQSMFTPWPPSMPVPPSVATQSCHTPLRPNSLVRPPHTWSKEEVRAWLEWCAGEFSIKPVSPDKFDMNGKALGLLNKSDFLERDPSSGDVLYNALQRLADKHESANQSCTYPFTPVATPSIINSFGQHTSCQPASAPPTPLPDHSQNGIVILTRSPTNGNAHTAFTTDRTQSSYVPILPGPYPSTPPVQRDLKIHIPESVLSPAPTDTEGSMLSDVESPEGDEEMAFREVEGNDVNQPADAVMRDMSADLNFRKGENDCRLLWEFIHQLLQENKYRDYVSWERPEELIFRIVNPTGLAELWGYQKNRTNMTYEKLSRALRYYYKMNIIKKVPGKRLTYQFLQHPRNIKKGQRGARPHASRVGQAGNPNISPQVQATEVHQKPLFVPQQISEPLPTRDTSPNGQKELSSPEEDSYANCECDLQLIDGRLQPTVDDDDIVYDTNDEPPSYIKQEVNHVPEQEEPEDLSMKTFHRRCSRESEDYRHIADEMTDEENKIKIESSS